MLPYVMKENYMICIDLSYNKDTFCTVVDPAAVQPHKEDKVRLNLLLMLFVTVDNISVKYVLSHRCVGGLKKQNTKR